ncbi:MAG TPA: hypothetical protein VIE44_13590 [Methylomirabilota bacterium]
MASREGAPFATGLNAALAVALMIRVAMRLLGAGPMPRRRPA